MAVGDDDRLDVLARARAGRRSPGSTRSIPSISAVGNRSPVSTTTIRSSYSTTVMFLPISPRPPSGRTRSVLQLTPAASSPWRSSIARTVAVSRSSSSDVGQPRQRRRASPSRLSAALTVARHRRDREVAVDVLQALVDLAPALGLVDHPAHLVAEEVAGDEHAAGLAEVEHVGEQVVVAGVDLQAVDLGRGCRRWPA